MLATRTRVRPGAAPMARHPGIGRPVGGVLVGGSFSKTLG